MLSFDAAGLKLRKSSRIYGLVDANSFYCSCERVFKPSLNGKPVGVLSNNDGCIIALTPELKALGVPMGAPAHLYQQILKENKVALFSSNYELYGDMSERVMATLQHFSPFVEVYSIDEAFLDFTHCTIPELIPLGAQIRRVILQRVGIPVGVGIGPTKTMAKLANKYAKKHAGVYSILEPNVDLYKSLLVSDVWGVSKGFYNRLLRRRITSVWDLVQCDDAWLLKNFPVTLVRTVYELRGYECLALTDMPKPKKHIMNSRSFGQYISDQETLASAITYHASRGGEEMRQQGLCASALNVFVQTNRHRADLPQYYGSTNVGFMTPTDYTPELVKAALEGLNDIYRPGFKIQKAGVMMLDLIPGGVRQQSLLMSRDEAKGQLLMNALDKVNGIVGKGTLRLGSEGFQQAWGMKQEKLSQRFTTRWAELLRI